MKVKETSYPRDEYESIAEYAKSKLDGSHYDSGALEAAGQTADNCASAIGRLLDVLATRGVLHAKDVSEIVDGYDCEIELSEEDE